MARTTLAAVLTVLVVCLLPHASPTRGEEPKPPAGAPSPAFREYRRPVTIWVPPYAVAKCRKQLDANPGIGDAITHLALQFWVPTKDGRAELLSKWESNDKAVAELRDWAHARGVRAMLCVYNAGGGDWDWPLAKAAFADHRDAFVKSLVDEIERHQLDGVDVDLEGNGDLDADKAAFVSFVVELSKALRARGKHLTVDTFAYKWNGPNQTWWADLFPHVDAIASMGYEQTGSAAKEWRAYAAQRDAAGANANKLQIGFPSGRSDWQGNSAPEHLEWVRKDGSVGIAIWDAQLRAEVWRSPETWATIKSIRGDSGK